MRDYLTAHYPGTPTICHAFLSLHDQAVPQSLGLASLPRYFPAPLFVKTRHLALTNARSQSNSCGDHPTNPPSEGTLVERGLASQNDGSLVHLTSALGLHNAEYLAGSHRGRVIGLCLADFILSSGNLPCCA